VVGEKKKKVVSLSFIHLILKIFSGDFYFIFILFLFYFILFYFLP